MEHNSDVNNLIWVVRAFMESDFADNMRAKLAECKNMNITAGDYYWIRNYLIFKLAASNPDSNVILDFTVEDLLIAVEFDNMYVVSVEPEGMFNRLYIANDMYKEIKMFMTHYRKFIVLFHKCRKTNVFLDFDGEVVSESLDMILKQVCIAARLSTKITKQTFNYIATAVFTCPEDEPPHFHEITTADQLRKLREIPETAASLSNLLHLLYSKTIDRQISFLEAQYMKMK